MPVKTFATGERLMAADVNNFLTNGGMRYIKQVSGTSTTALNVNDCFSSTYQSYFVLVSRVVITSGNLYMLVRLRVSGTDAAGNDYYYGATECGYAAGSTATGFNGAGATSAWNSGHVASTNDSAFGFHVHNPFLTRMTGFSGLGTWPTTTGRGATFSSGYHNLATSYTGFTLLGAFAPTMSNVTVTVYGYRTTAP